jgi:hypothetical protein
MGALEEPVAARTGEEIAALAVILALDEASLNTGATIPAGGGFLAHHHSMR